MGGPLGTIQANGNTHLDEGVIVEAGEAGQANRSRKVWFKGGGELIRDGRVKMSKIRHHRCV